MAALLVLAGCSSVMPGDSGGTGTVNFYMSDQPGAIEEFEHLNVTVDEVTFVAADGNQTTYDANGTYDLTELKGENASLVSEYEVESGNYTKVFLSVNETTGTLKDGESTTVKLPSEKLQLTTNFTVGEDEEVDFVYDVMVTKAGGSGKYVLRPVVSESGTDVEINEVDARTEGAAQAGQQGNASMAERQGSLDFYVSDEQNAIDDFEHLNVTVTEVGFQRGGDSGNWSEHDVDNRTVDLTELKGDNATLLQTFDVSEGNYTAVVVEIEDVNGTLKEGGDPDVKLPSNRIKLNTDFSVEANESTEFVYDITVVERGNSGAYNIKPVASQSGTDVPIKRVDSAEDAESDDEAPENDTETTSPDLNATFVGNVSAGENATVSVTQNGTAVENATVTYNGTEYTTDADGAVTFAVSENATEVVVTVTYEEREVELEREFESDDSSQEDGQANDNGQYALTEA
ncbi:DUF4382 domain-containing protein [Halorarius litoreus]|uniref:DUF4382 domain-containing protein n=1 Tax=Halorarius litoreus TaxID=2962676 RepID=UPI0020CC28E9|nr:DUF4382 domain-containing protein [Halorarius litoreus]